MSTIQFAWVNNFNEIDLIINGNTIPTNMLLLTESGEQIRYTIEQEKRDDFFHLIIKTQQAISLSDNLYFLHRQRRFYLYPTLPFLNKHYTTNKQLGPSFSKDKITFRLWSPTAQKVEIILLTPLQYNYLYSYQLRPDANGVWEIELPLHIFPKQSAHLFGYTYKVTSRGYQHSVLDPYAKSLSTYIPPSLPYSIIIDPDELTPFLNDSKSNGELLTTPTKFIGYEAHIRDFTIDPSAPIKDRKPGTFEAFQELAPYFQDLGITHLQLMPIQKFQTVNEQEQTYQNQNIPTEEINYNWGYDPMHYFTLEGWYSTNPTDPLSRIQEFSNLVNTFHQHNIGIIVDVVYNHIYDHRVLEFVAPGCYLRRNRWGDISYGTGAGATLESRCTMVRKLIIDSLKYLVDTFKVNGFRFDLMSFLDHQTMIEIRHTLGEDIILYGEAWNFTDLPFEQAITKTNYPANIQLGVFNDSARDAFIGHLDEWGIVQGNYNENLKAKSVILGGIQNYPHDYNGDGRNDVILGSDPYNYFAHSPINTINFLDIHDGFTLWDKINLTVDGSQERKERIMRRALSLLFSSQGRLVIHGGVEMKRSKPMAANDPTPYRAHSSHYLLPNDQDQFFHENSYHSSDWTNAIRWKTLDTSSILFRHVKKLIELRRSYKATHLDTAEDIYNNVRFIEKRPPASSHSYKSFSELPSLIIRFINGHPNTTYFIVGEIHPDTNPTKNPIEVTFDQNGQAEVFFTATQIKKFDTTKWGFASDLQVKLVKTPGKWDYPTEFYTSFGHNLISLYTLDQQLTVTINLAYKDYHSILNFVEEPSLLAYTLSDSKKSLIIIHNLSDNCRELQISSKEFKDLTLFNLIKHKIVQAPFKIHGHSSKIYESPINTDQLFLQILKEEPCYMA